MAAAATAAVANARKKTGLTESEISVLARMRTHKLGRAGRSSMYCGSTRELMYVVVESIGQEAGWLERTTAAAGAAATAAAAASAEKEEEEEKCNDPMSGKKAA